MNVTKHAHGEFEHLRRDSVASSAVENRTISVVVSSTSAIKLEAVERVLSGRGVDAKIDGVKVGSGVSEQPMGDETLSGARNRVKNAMAERPGADLYVSIENGIFSEGHGKDAKYVDKAVVVCVDKSGHEHVAYSDGVEFPKDAVEEARRRGFATTTVGEVLKEQGRVKDNADPHFELTGGKKHRADFLQQAVSEAVAGALA